MNSRRLFLICFMFVLVFIHSTLCADSYEGKEIVEIRYEGLVVNDEFDVRPVINTKKGSILDLRTIDEDLKALYNLQLFEDISVDVEETEGGVVVTFEFTELPVVRNIKINGNRKVKDRKIKERILLKEDEVFRESELFIDVENIKTLYEEKGRPESKVSYEVEEVIEKKKRSDETYRAVDVTFDVEESRKIIVRSIAFSGNENIPDRELYSTMETKERGYLFNLGFFQESRFELDKDLIEAYYADRGYVDAKVIKVDMVSEMNERIKREELDITIFIEEGRQYTFAGAEISGNKIFTDEELYEQITLDEGDVYDKSEWEKSVQGIRNLLTSNGYIYFAMNVDEKKDRENLTISYSIDITENSKAHIHNIFVTGNDKTKDFVIEREVVIKEGEIFNRTKIERTVEKLYSLQYFSAVNVDIKPGTELGLVDLIFDVEEGRTGLFSFGLTYSTSGRGISFYEEVSENNFLGRGLRLYEKVQLGFTQQIVEFGLDEPWLFNKPVSAGISFSFARTVYGKQSGDEVYIYDEDNNLPDGTNIPKGVTYVVNPDDGSYSLDFSDAESMQYVNKTYRLALRLGRRFARYYGVDGELSFSVFQNYNGTGDIPYDEDLYKEWEAGYPWNWKNYLKLNVYRDSRDIPYFAKRGSYLSQDIYFYGGLLGGYSNFIRLDTDVNFNFKTFWKFVLATRVNFGFIVPYPGQSVTADSVSDLLRVDTWNEGRGWSQPSQFPSLYSLRGESEFNFSLEYRYPIVERFVWGLLFFDASGIYPKTEEFTLNPKELWYSFGAGASLVVPGIPVRIYLARRFKYDYSVGRYQLVNSQNFFQDWDFVFSVAGYF